MAAEHLTEQEREALLTRLMEECDGSREDWTGLRSFARVCAEVERIVADRLSKQAEQIAQAIEAAAVAADVDMIEVHGAFVRRAPYAAEHLRDAARIAREHKEGQ